MIITMGNLSSVLDNLKHICDFCRESNIKLQTNQHVDCFFKYNTQKKKNKAHDTKKKGFIENCKTDSLLLVLEFNCSQNLPVPKLNCTSQLYCRLLWLYLFNVHVHNDGTSYFFCFMESMSKKNTPVQLLPFSHM